MKQYSFVFFIVIPLLSFCQRIKKMNLYSNDALIHYKIDNMAKVDKKLSLSANLKKDIIRAEIAEAHNSNINIVSDIDSISLSIKIGDTLNLPVIVKGDTTYLKIIGKRKDVNFDASYQKKHNDSLEVNIPEVSELINIGIAISNLERRDSNMVYMESDYYKEVIRKFSPYKRHPFITLLNKYIKDNGAESYDFHYDLKGNACEYNMDNYGSIKNRGNIFEMSLYKFPNPVEQNLTIIEDFARETKFREFYKQNLPMYQGLITDFRNVIPVGQMWRWLESKSSERYNSYKMYLSPLTGGAHACQYFEDNGFKQISMYLAGRILKPTKGLPISLSGAVMTFTEIDHAYINPLTNRYSSQMDSLMIDDIWTDSLNRKFYKSGKEIFNEYMTWGLFTLFAYENYPSSSVDPYISKIETFMAKRRGFTKFREFNQFLKKLYFEEGKPKIADLYPMVITWCLEKNNL